MTSIRRFVLRVLSFFRPGAFGRVEQAKKHQRDARGFRWLDNSRMDFTLGARMLAKYPAVASIFMKAALQLATGVVVGVVLALLTDRASDGELLGSFGRALLPVTAVVMTNVGLCATIGPARRGLRIQPTEALRAE